MTLFLIYDINLLSKQQKEEAVLEGRFELFTISILKISRAILKIKSIEMEKYNLKPIHAICIYYLSMTENGLSQAQLVKKCEEDKAMVSRALSLLEQRGLVHNSQDKATKNYNSTLTLTASGLSLAKEIQNHIENIFANIGLSELEREQFYMSLNKIANSLSFYSEALDK